MKTELKDVLHLYLGCECEHDTYGKFELNAHVYSQINLPNGSYKFDNVKPILRPLSNIELEEMAILKWNEKDELKHAIANTNRSLYMTEFLYLLKEGFDLFGLIESGQAIDKTTLNGYYFRKSFYIPPEPEQAVDTKP